MSDREPSMTGITRAACIREIMGRHNRLVRESATWLALLDRSGIHLTETTPMPKLAEASIDHRADSVRARLEDKIMQYLTLGDACFLREQRAAGLSWLEIGTEARRRGVYLPGQAWPDTRSGNLIAGLALCKVAAEKLREDPTKEPWN